jgi:hypothetical protein
VASGLKTKEQAKQEWRTSLAARERPRCDPRPLALIQGLGGQWTDLPETDPIFSGGALRVLRDLLTSEELKAAQAHELDEEVEFVSPRVPGRMQRGASTPESEGE